ncbi:MAG: hypothetical protein GWN67_18150 [Phycisphaerae bacterium]|nr:hypothetical protein [Phycisphaerae bacterium]NIP55966.1 hypothetical protein [Phycisphaerae bacterium]NIS54531.1 hypothetical protein [Phycisphaerae bacterium]NIU12167.1 hypothetical protein [Phycisphaerae bacterium]NIU58234.1 hypothetical protein [Phycisphaerae bacterium]
MKRLRRAHQRQLRKQAKRRKKLKQRAVAAGTAAVITLGVAAAGNRALAQYTPDPHELPVSQDADGDLLTDAEETAINSDVSDPDQNDNLVPDGVELAKLCAADINDLPTWDPQSGDPEPNETYKWYILTFGLETCDICGQQFNMGSVVVVNPNRSLTVNCPIISMHYMEHGSYSYAGSTNKGRLDVPTLLKALELRLSCGPDDHQLPVPEDPDADLLANKEEFAIGYRPFDDDQNENEIPDGVELAKRLAADVNDLPQWYGFGDPPKETYKYEHALDGTEKCHVCGDDIHMGGWGIINPKLGLKYPSYYDPLNETFLPDLALHYMEHGSFDCYGGIHNGRVNLQRLMRVLERRFPHDPNEHQLPLDANDLDNDLLSDSEELAAGYNLYEPDQDEDLTPDGIELARQCGEVIEALPVHDPSGGDPPPEQTYKVNYFQRGLEQCEICGAMRNMGWWQVINPKLEMSIDVPDIVCHYMGHGSFSYAGDVHGKGRIDIPLLVKILEMPRRCGDLGTIYLPGDLNQDCSENFKDIAEVADKWLESTDPKQDG